MSEQSNPPQSATEVIQNDEKFPNEIPTIVLNATFEQQPQTEQTPEVKNIQFHHQQTTTTHKDFSLPVVYVTSTAIFVPEIVMMNSNNVANVGSNNNNNNASTTTTISSSSTILHQLASEDAPDQSLASIVGATSAAGSGLMVHIFRFLDHPARDDKKSNINNYDDDDEKNPSSKAKRRLSSSLNQSHNQKLDNSNSNNNNSHKNRPSPPPLVALLDEEEASTQRGAGGASGTQVSPYKLEKRVLSIKKHVKSLRFLPDELERFLHSACLDVEATQLVRSLVDSVIPRKNESTEDVGELNGGGEQYLASIAGVLVGHLPKVRIQKYEEGNSFVKVLVR